MSGAYMELTYEKTEGLKSRGTVPLTILNKKNKNNNNFNSNWMAHW